MLGTGIMDELGEGRLVEKKFCDPLGMGSEGKRKPQQVSCYRDDSGDWDRKSRRRQEER